MCGINGLVDFNRILNKEEISAIVNNFNNTLFHRGPDSSGVKVIDNIGLGHTRLSIIDLSNNGLQPMENSNNKTVISYNGEVYNYLSLKKKYLHSETFFSNTDTEVILKLYSKIGIEKLIQEINGMYAFCIFDKKKNKIFLSRDKIGKKPLYYYFKDDFVIWSSELNCFKNSPIGNKLKISKDALKNFFDVGYVPSPLSIFENIQKLLPGETLEINLNNKIKKSFFFEKNENEYKNEKFNIESLEETLEDAVRIRTISDVPYGVFLSSGIDSTLVAAILRKIKSSNINSFSIGLENSILDESKSSKKIAESLGLEHNELIINEKNLIDTIPKMVETYSEPFADSSQIPTYILSKFCKEKITVALSGDGGDEIFGGYNRYIYYKKYKYILKILFQFNKFKILDNKFFEKIFSHSAFSKFKESAYKIKKFNKILNHNDYYHHMIKQSNNIEKIFKNNDYYDVQYLKGLDHNDPLTNMQIRDVNNYLPDDILTKVDRASMAHSLEVRCPLLDKRLHNYVGIENNLKIFGQNSKILLRKILSKHINMSLISKKKMGFAIPIHKWLSTDVYELGNDLIHSELLSKDEYLDQKYIIKIWELNRAGNKNYAYLLWSVLIYLNWKNIWIK